LDPFEQHDDFSLNDALSAAESFSYQEDLGEARLTLDSNIASGGAISVLQKLAPARGSKFKVLILDKSSSRATF